MLIKRVYEVNPLQYPQCGGQMAVVVLVEPPRVEVTGKIRRGHQSGAMVGGLSRSSATRASPRHAGAHRLNGYHRSDHEPHKRTDNGTSLDQQVRLDLTILCQCDSLLHNRYAVIVVNSRKHAGVNHKTAIRFSEFLLAFQTQEVIEFFGVKKYGQLLFVSPRQDH